MEKEPVNPSIIENKREILKSVETETLISDLPEEDLINYSYPEKDPRRWLRFFEHDNESTINQYYNNLGLTDAMLSQKENILDIGANIAEFAAHCQAKNINANVVSLEPEPWRDEVLNETQKMFLGEKLYQENRSRMVAGVVEKMPFKDESFDLIVDHAAMPGFNYSLRQTAKMRTGVNDAFEEILRVLRPGGEARLFSLPALNNDRTAKWRPALDAKLVELKKSGRCDVFIEDIINPDTGEISEDKRVILKKKYEKAKISQD